MRMMNDSYMYVCMYVCLYIYIYIQFPKEVNDKKQLRLALMTWTYSNLIKSPTSGEICTHYVPPLAKIE